MKLPASPIDAQDRRLVGMALVLVLASVLGLVLLSATAGIMVRVFSLAAWGG